MLRLKMLGKLKESALILPEFPEGADDATVKKTLEDFSQHLRKEVLPILEAIDVRSQKLTDQTGPLQTTLIQTTSGGGGDLIQQNNVPIYLSLVL